MKTNELARLNIQLSELANRMTLTGITICDKDHDKTAPCYYREIAPTELFALLKQFQQECAMYRKLHDKVQEVLSCFDETRYALDLTSHAWSETQQPGIFKKKLEELRNSVSSK